MKLIKKFLEANPYTIRTYKITKNRASIQTVFDEVIVIKKEKKYYDVDITTTIKEFHDIHSYRLDCIDIFKLLNDCVFNFYRGMDVVYDYMTAKQENNNDEDDNV